MRRFAVVPTVPLKTARTDCPATLMVKFAVGCVAEIAGLRVTASVRFAVAAPGLKMTEYVPALVSAGKWIDIALADTDPDAIWKFLGSNTA